jgi:hypothetical protein
MMGLFVPWLALGATEWRYQKEPKGKGFGRGGSAGGVGTLSGCEVCSLAGQETQ